MPRTTLDIDASVLRELKQRQQRERKSLGQLASELLARALAEDTPEPRAFAWFTKDLKPKVDLEDSDELWRILDAE